MSYYLYPKIAIIDPELTLTVPKKVTASSGIDVLSHALESYYSKNNNPISDILAIESVKIPEVVGNAITGIFLLISNLFSRKYLMLVSIAAIQEDIFRYLVTL